MSCSDCKIPLQTLSVNQLVISLVVGHMIVVPQEIHFWLLKNKAKYDYWFCFIKYATWIILPLPLGSYFKTPLCPLDMQENPQSLLWHTILTAGMSRILNIVPIKPLHVFILKFPFKCKFCHLNSVLLFFITL